MHVRLEDNYMCEKPEMLDIWVSGFLAVIV